ncbi:hypothetical protein SLUN_04800 [Streptomyces lunaelactis]|uniref:ESAT-6-like protein n=1 Tax=Streptomyces lunaelactis TaxID=1535768 RepID=A0A2R4SXJ5_9ACTN|nr:hypothetical protein [Streptomyces lunaelactis]AVZ71610.1 hypothetical protein SLUN_04800 [Streptomyces lunaelactis]NUK89210.1 hypothetical protein [Streptomyces lunaelactis]NUL07441.1 hypothetical protein [Streptomyces lunaelactis]
MPADQPVSESIEAMTAARPYFEEALGDINRALGDMQANIERLRTWTGETAGTFIAAMETWMGHGNAVKNRLQLMVDTLQAHTGNVANTHQTTVDAAAQVSSGVNALQGF